MLDSVAKGNIFVNANGKKDSEMKLSHY